MDKCIIVRGFWQTELFEWSCISHRYIFSHLSQKKQYHLQQTQMTSYSTCLKHMSASRQFEKNHESSVLILHNYWPLFQYQTAISTPYILFSKQLFEKKAFLLFDGRNFSIHLKYEFQWHWRVTMNVLLSCRKGVFWDFYPIEATPTFKYQMFWTNVEI